MLAIFRYVMHCKNAPCVSGCPVNVPIPDFIDKIKEGDFNGAYQVIRSQNALPAICGRVCPQESQCESKCVRGINERAAKPHCFCRSDQDGLRPPPAGSRPDST